MDELFLFHETITSKERFYGPVLVEKAFEKRINHIRFIPIEMSRFQFMKGQFRKTGGDTKTIKDYISGLLSGRLAEPDEKGLILKTDPEDIASIIKFKAHDELLEKCNRSYGSIVNL